MAADSPEARSCLKFRDAGSNKLYFVSVLKKGGAGDASVDMAVTDGSSGWTASGLTAADVRGQAASKLEHFLAALTDLQPARLPYQTEFAQRDGSLLVKVSWQASPADPRILVSASLAPAPHAAPLLCAMLELLVDNLAVLRGVSEDLVGQIKEYDKQVQQQQHLVDAYVKNKEAHDREMNVKVAALLNSKKQKLRELEQQLKEAQEENQRLKEGGVAAAETEPMEADGGGSGRTGGRARGGGSAHGAGDAGSDVEEEEDGEEEREAQSPERY